MGQEHIFGAWTHGTHHECSRVAEVMLDDRRWNEHTERSQMALCILGLAYPFIKTDNTMAGLDPKEHIVAYLKLK